MKAVISLLKRLKEQWLTVILATAIVMVILLWLTLVFIFHSSQTSQAVMDSKQAIPFKLITQAALNDLIQRAAELRYIQKVFQDLPALPSVKSAIVLPRVMTPSPMTIRPPATPRCIYQGQAYVAGDMIKTERGWMRCMATVKMIQNPVHQNGQLLLSWVPNLKNEALYSN